MPYSEPDNKEWIVKKLKEINPKKMLDVGTGVGIYGDLARIFLPDTHVDGVEVFEPYFQMFGLTQKYNRMLQIDVRELPEFEDYDVIIFGDVLEHMTKEEAISLWEKASKHTKWAIITIPVIHNEQGPVYGNPYETHVEEDWSVDSVLKSFKGIVEHKVFSITGAFIAKFED